MVERDDHRSGPQGLADLVGRKPVVPWDGASKIPWHEPGFSRRMLREHLSQSHDRASRRFDTIDRQVRWIHEHVLGSRPARILDLGCGPGFYTSRLARLGHRCVGIDFSPASVAHARSEAEQEELVCHYRQEDLRTADFGDGFELALLIFGEFNTFEPNEARALLANVRSALSPSGALLLEAHPAAQIRSIGLEGPSWFTARESVFADEPHLCLRECAWHAEMSITTERYFVVSLESSEVARYVSTTQAYSDAEYESLLHDARFAGVERHASLSGELREGERELFVALGR